jgi:hypothetical protein
MQVDFPGSELGCFEPGNVFRDFCASASEYHGDMRITDRKQWPPGFIRISNLIVRAG